MFFPKRNLYNELAMMGLTKKEVLSVLKWTETLPIEIVDTDVTVSIWHGRIRVERLVPRLVGSRVRVVHQVTYRKKVIRRKNQI